MPSIVFNHSALQNIYDFTTSGFKKGKGKEGKKGKRGLNII